MLVSFQKMNPSQSWSPAVLSDSGDPEEPRIWERLQHMCLNSPPRKRQHWRWNNKAPDITWGSVKCLCQRAAEQATQAGHGTNPQGLRLPFSCLLSSPHNLGENHTLDLGPSSFNQYHHIKGHWDVKFRPTLYNLTQEVIKINSTRFNPKDAVKVQRFFSGLY
jgi:hypothetical protein